jgi:hypothetical protein
MRFLIVDASLDVMPPDRPFLVDDLDVGFELSVIIE